ncbi:MAG: response regulator [Deltaproteobacteria bacterium]|jgi:CheY-like chemotaxis protein|nr:response regulator [Deltaproteobacteria bacterium]
MGQFFGWTFGVLLIALVLAPWAMIVFFPVVLAVGIPMLMTVALTRGLLKGQVIPYRPRVLVVDDDAVSVAPVLYLLSSRNADVKYVASGKEALFQLSQTKFDFLVLDLSLPDVDGDQVIANHLAAVSVDQRVGSYTSVYFHTSSPEKVGTYTSDSMGPFVLKEVFAKGSSLADMRRCFDSELAFVG